MGRQEEEAQRKREGDVPWRELLRDS